MKNRLIEAELNARKLIVREKPLSTERMKEARLEWGQRIFNWSEEMWRKVIYLDESGVSHSENDKELLFGFVKLNNFY